MLLLGKKMPFSRSRFPGQEGASSRGGITSPGSSRRVQQEPWMPGHPSAVDGDGSCRTNP